MGAEGLRRFGFLEVKSHVILFILYSCTVTAVWALQIELKLVESICAKRSGIGITFASLLLLCGFDVYTGEICNWHDTSSETTW